MARTNKSSQLHDFNVRDEILLFILASTKKLEIRTASSRFLKVNEGDYIRFNNLSDCVRRVSEIRHYNNFNELLANIDPEEVMPGMPKKTMLSLLREIYPPNKEALGILAFRIEQSDVRG